MWTAAKVAERDGVSKQAVTKKVRDLVETHGLMVERNVQGAIVAFNVAQYDYLRGRYGDPSKAQAPLKPQDPPPRPDRSGDDTYDEALRQKTWHEAEKRRLELEEIKGALVRRDRLTSAIERCGEQIVRIFDRLPLAADELAAAVAKGGSHEARLVLKALASKMRAETAKRLNQLAGDAPADDEDEASGEST